MNLQDQIEIMEAVKANKKIEFLAFDGKTWYDYPYNKDTRFNFVEYAFRVKPI